MSSPKKSLIAGSAWTALGAGIANCITILTWGLVGKELGPVDLGKVFLIQSTMQMMSMLASAGQGINIIRFTAEGGTKSNSQLSPMVKASICIILFSCTIVSLFIYIGHDALTNNAFGSIDKYNQRIVLFSLFIFLTLEAIFKSLLIGMERFKESAFISLLSSVFGSVAMILLSSELGYFGCIIGLCCSPATQCVASAFILRDIKIKESGTESHPNRPYYYTKAIHLGIPTLAASMLHLPTFWLIQLYLSKTANGFTLVALIGICNQWISALSFLPQTVSRILFPILSRLSLKSPILTKSILFNALLINFSISLLTALLVFGLMDYIKILYVSVQSFSTIIWVSLFVSLTISIQAPLGNFLVSKGRVWMAASSNLVWSISYISLTVLFTNITTDGALYAMLISYTIHMLATILLFKVAVR